MNEFPQISSQVIIDGKSDGGARGNAYSYAYKTDYTSLEFNLLEE